MISEKETERFIFKKSPGGLYLTESSDQPNPLTPTSFGDRQYALSQKSYKTVESDYQTSFDNTPLSQADYPASSQLTKRETATTFDPSDLGRILGKESSNRFTHFTKVKTHEKSENAVRTPVEEKQSGDPADVIPVSFPKYIFTQIFIFFSLTKIIKYFSFRKFQSNLQLRVPQLIPSLECLNAVILALIRR